MARFYQRKLRFVNESAAASFTLFCWKSIFILPGKCVFAVFLVILYD